MPLRSITFLVYFFGSSAAALAFPMVGVICYIVLYHVYPQSTWWGASIQFLGIRYAYVCGVCLFIGTVLNLNRLPFGRRFMHPVEWGMLLVFLAMLISTATGTPWDYLSAMFLDKMAKVFLFSFMLSHVVVTRRRVWLVVATLVLLALYLGHEAKIAPLSKFTHNRLDGIGGPDFAESSGLAVHLFALLPFIVLLLRHKSLWMRLVAFLSACYSINAILLCRTRSAFVAGMTAGAMAIWYVPRRQRRWVVVVLLLGVIGSAVLSDQWFRERMLTILSSAEERDRSAATRLTIWATAWEMFKQNPMGVGIGHFEREIGNYAADRYIERRDAHNSFVLCATETGIFGITAFVATLAMSWRTLARLNRRAKARLANPQPFEHLIFANRLALLVYIVAGLFVSRFYTEALWWLIVLPVSLSRAVENEIRAEAREEVVVPVQLLGQAGHGGMPELAL